MQGLQLHGFRKDCWRDSQVGVTLASGARRLFTSGFAHWFRTSEWLPTLGEPGVLGLLFPDAFTTSCAAWGFWEWQSKNTWDYPRLGTTVLVNHWSRRNPLAATLTGLSRVCFQEQLNAMLPAAGTYHFPWEINSALIPEGKTLRTFGRLCFYNTVSSEAILTAQHASVQHQIRVCTKFVEPFQAHLGSLYIVLGETDYGESVEVVIKARVFSCVEGINLQLLQKAIEEQRKYFHERKNHLEAHPS